ncbi:MAG: methyl-accepting chemotaxis protein [Promethearchaeota archaeon]
MGVYRYLKINSVGTPWVLVTEMDYSEAMAMPLAMVQILLWALVILTIVAIVFGFSISNKIANPIIELNRVTYKIANGDLSNHNILKIKASDEVKELSESFSMMRNRLADIVLKIRAIAEQLSSSSEELSSSVQEISGSAQNIAGTQQQITKGAQEQAKMILDTQDLVKKLAQGIKDIKENSEQITQVTDIVDNIANQTNILSINASIEAVKAGEIGKGFGVVAERIKRLADESKMNLTKTDTMIKNTLETIKAQEGQALNIVNIIDSIASIAEETSASTEEASAASEEIASSMEEITSTAEVLTEYAEELYEHVLFFKTSDDLEQDKNKQTSSEENTKNLKITPKISKYKNISAEENSSFKDSKKIGDNSYNKTSLFNTMKSNVGITEDDRETESEQLKHLDSAF